MGEPEWLNERERRAWYGFLTMQEDVRRHMNRQLLRDAGLSLADFVVLSALSQQPDGSLRVFELREALRWEKTRLTHQISRMIKAWAGGDVAGSGPAFSLVQLGRIHRITGAATPRSRSSTPWPRARCW